MLSFEISKNAEFHVVIIEVMRSGSTIHEDHHSNQHCT